MGGCAGDGREPGPGDAPRGTAEHRDLLARSAVQDPLPERQGVRAHAPGSGLCCPGHPHRDPASFSRGRRQPCPAPRPRRVGDLRHGPDRLLRRRRDTALLGPSAGAWDDERVQCSGAESVRGGAGRSVPAGPWHKIWRQAVWLVVLIAYIYAAATVGTVTNGSLAESAGRVAVAVVLGVAFFWWGLRFLIGGRVSYLAALPGAVATLVGLTGLRAFSSLVFEPLIIRNAVSYGALGTVLIVESWLIGVGWVVYGGQLFGRWFYDAWMQAWAQRRWGHTEPGDEGEQPPGRQGTPPQ